MDRLNGPSRLMIVSDLDFTMVDHEEAQDISLLRFNALWEAYYRQDSLLVYSTGRSPTIYKQLRNEKPLLTSDITIMSVGTEIAYGESMLPDYDWEQFLNFNWDRDIVIQETSKFPQLIPQSDTEQRPHKVSFFLEKPKSLEVIKELTECLEKCGLDIKIIYSNGTALDVLPKAAGKGQALAYLLKKLKANGRIPLNSLVCGDSEMMLNFSPFLKYMVSNAQEELLRWHEENAINNPNIIRSTERCASGIVQAIGKFALGPNVSPRDIRESRKCRVNNFSPGHEVVKFYIFYERWRHAEVEKSGHAIKFLGLAIIKHQFCLEGIGFIEDGYSNAALPELQPLPDSELCSFILSAENYTLGTYVHPSGTVKPMNKFIDMMEGIYGDKQGTQYCVWLDRVSTAQIGSDAWLVKFDKWESTGDNRYCGLTTVLLTTKHDEESFTWMHIHQTWLYGSEAKDQTIWFL